MILLLLLVVVVCGSCNNYQYFIFRYSILVSGGGRGESLVYCAISFLPTFK